MRFLTVKSAINGLASRSRPANYARRTRTDEYAQAFDVRRELHDGQIFCFEQRHTRTVRRISERFRDETIFMY